MKFSEIRQSIIAQFSQDRADANACVPFILGAPGGGKSACARVAFEDLGATADNMVEFTASLRDPVDVLGTPDNKGDFTKWVPPEEFYKLRKGQGKCFLLLEELSDAPIPMQNALCGVIYDRRAGQLELSDELIIVATGNRTEDKSGANRITSKLAGRTRRFDFTENLDELVAYALEKNWPADLIQFLRFRPEFVAKFNPNDFANPTPRTWEDVSRINPKLAGLDAGGLFFANVAGSVGEGPAAEYTAFRKIYLGLPDIAEVLKNPTKAVVPSDLATQYAVMGALARHVDKTTFANMLIYVDKFKKEFQIMAVRDALKVKPEVGKTAEFMKWASANASILI